MEENLHISQIKLTNSVTNQTQKIWTPITVTQCCRSENGEVRGKWKNLHFLCKVYQIHKLWKETKGTVGGLT